jgi:hypothetical protein
VRELIQKERKKEVVFSSPPSYLSFLHEKLSNFYVKVTVKYLQEKKKLEQGGTPLDPSKIKEKEKEIVLRPLNMKDLKEAKNQVNPSSSTVQV